MSSSSSSSSLLAKVCGGDVEAVREFIEEAEAAAGGEGGVGALDVNQKEPETWDTPLHKAALGGHAEIVKVLLAVKADPNQENIKGRTCLHTACEVYVADTTGDFCWEDVIVELVEGGAVAIKDIEDQLPFAGDDAVRRVENAVNKAFTEGKELRTQMDATRKERNRAKMDKMFEEKLVAHISNSSGATVAVRESPSRPDGWG